MTELLLLGGEGLRFAELLGGLGFSAEAGEGHGVVAVSGDVVWRVEDGLAEELLSGRVISVAEGEDAHAGERAAVVGVELEDVGEFCFGLGVLAAIEGDDAEFVIGCDLMGLQGDGAAQLGDGFVVLRHHVEEMAEAVVGGGVVGSLLEVFAEVLFGGGHVLLVELDVGQCVEGAEVGGVEAVGLIEGFGGIVVDLHGVCLDAEVGEELGRVGDDFESGEEFGEGSVLIAGGAEGEGVADGGLDRAGLGCF